MNRKVKKLEKFLKNPGSLRFAQIHVLLLDLGFKHKRISGSHHFYQNAKLSADISIPTHNNDCKQVYKKLASKLIKKLIS